MKIEHGHLQAKSGMAVKKKNGASKGVSHNLKKNKESVPRSNKNKKKTNNPIKDELINQKKFLAKKYAVNAGMAMVNNYLASRNYTMDGRPMRINKAARKIVNTAMNMKYTRDYYNR